MQFSVRALLCTTTFVAIAAAFWPDPNRGPETAYYLFVALTTLLACSILLASAAWRLARNRKPAEDANRFNREKLAFVLALFGLLPFAALWTFSLVEPYEKRGGAIDQLVHGLWYLALGSYVPAGLGIAASLSIFFGPRRNPPLLALRVIWAVACVAVPLFIRFFILARLG